MTGKSSTSSAGCCGLPLPREAPVTTVAPPVTASTPALMAVARPPSSPPPTRFAVCVACGCRVYRGPSGQPGSSAWMSRRPVSRNQRDPATGGAKPVAKRIGVRTRVDSSESGYQSIVLRPFGGTPGVVGRRQPMSVRGGRLVEAVAQVDGLADVLRDRVQLGRELEARVDAASQVAHRVDGHVALRHQAEALSAEPLAVVVEALGDQLQTVH